MHTTYPIEIENSTGEKLVFKSLQPESDGDRLLVENFAQPGAGPVMHTHWLQDESLTVVKGQMGYQIEGQPAQFAREGETVLFARGVPHRFWNEGNEVLHCRGWVKPANTIVFFLSALFAAQKKTGTDQPDLFDGAYLMHRYASEYDLPEVPRLVKKLVIPATYRLGRVLGKYRHFRNAPAPVR